MTQQEFEKEWLNDSDFVLCHTSGSTGTPKEIKLRKDMMRQSAGRTNNFFGIGFDSHLHTCLDFQYIASKMMTVRADVANCLLTSEPPSNRPLERFTGDDEITLLSVVPSQMLWILDNPAIWKRLKNILIGGSPIPSLIRHRIALSGINAWETYGMTETASHIALRKVTSDETAPFKTLPGITVSSGSDGCLVIKIPGIDAVNTTDLAEVISDSEFRIFGRSDNCIISGGVKIIPEQLENLLGPFIAFDFCISSVPDAKWGEKAVLVVQLSDSVINEDVLRKAVALRLNQYKKIMNLGVKTPKDVIIVKSFPCTSNGKIDRKAIKELLHGTEK